MNFKVLDTRNGKVLELDRSNVLDTVENFIDLIGNARYAGASNLLIYTNSLPKGFLDLKTRLAGEILQKFSTYQMRLAIIGEFNTGESQSLASFIAESNRTKHVLFLSSRNEALKMWNV